MSKFIGRNPLPPIVGTNDVLAWDGTEFRPTRSVSVNPIFGAISATALALAIGTGISDSNAIGFLPDTSTAGSEKLTMYVGGVSGPVWTRSGSAVTLAVNSLTTSGGVVFNSAAGLLQNSAGLTYSANILIAGDGTAGATFRVNGAAGNSRQINFQSGAVNRWLIVGATGTAEGGGNAGSNFVIQAFDDAGVTIDNPISISRVAAGAITFVRPLQPGSGSAGAPSYAFSSDTTTGLYRVSSGVAGIVCAGTERFRFGANQFVVSQNANAIGTGATGSVGSLTLHGADSSQPSIAICGYTAVPTLFFRRAEGTGASPSQTTNGISLGQVAVEGYEATTPGFTAQKTAWLAISTEAFTSTANGFRQDFFVIANGATAVSRCVRFDQDGNVLIGTVTNGMTAAGSLAIAQDLAHRGSNLGVFNTTPTTKKTGYGTPTGGSLVSSYPGATATLAQTSGTLAQLLLDLKAYGLLGA